jgi:hypothetical protein
MLFNTYTNNRAIVLVFKALDSNAIRLFKKFKKLGYYFSISNYSITS